jgi:xylulokinase
MVKNEYFVGVDIGTQSTKTIIVNREKGKIVGKATKTYGLIEGLPPGNKEQDPKVWINALNYTIKQAIEESKIPPKEIKAIGVSGQQHGLVPLDEEGNVIRPVKLWNDTSTIEECEYLTRKLGGKKRVIELLGLTIPPGFTASKILWLKRHEPENFKKLITILLPHDYINFYLTGNKVMEFGDASGTALMNIRTRKWCKQILQIIDLKLEDKLPQLNSSDKSVGIIRKEIAKKFGLCEDVVVSAGGGDNMLGAIGTGNTHNGIVTASLGTSGTIYAYSDIPVVDQEGEIAAFCDSTNGWLPLLCTMSVTVATEFVRNLFGLSYDELTKAVEEVPVGSEGLILLPYFEGERTPNIPDGTGVYYGLNTKTFNKPYFARAAMESVTMGMNYGLNRMRELGIKPTQIRLTGGGSKNKAWRKIAANVFGVEVVCLKKDEGAAYGAALQSIYTYNNYLGEKTSIQDITDYYVEVDEETLITPKHDNVQTYKELQKIQNHLSLILRKSFILHRRFLDKYNPK